MTQSSSSSKTYIMQTTINALKPLLDRFNAFSPGFQDLYLSVTPTCSSEAIDTMTDMLQRIEQCLNNNKTDSAWRLNISLMTLINTTILPSEIANKNLAFAEESVKSMIVNVCDSDTMVSGIKEKLSGFAKKPDNIVPINSTPQWRKRFESQEQEGGPLTEKELADLLADEDDKTPNI